MGMFYRIFKGVLAGVLLVSLQACQDKAAEGPTDTATEPAAPAVVEPPAGVFAPKGMEGATVIVRPAGNAEITNVDGFHGQVTRSPHGDQFSRIMLPPGEHVLHLVRVGANKGLNIRWQAEAGEYFATGIDYLFKGEKFWAPVIVKDAVDGTIVADKDDLLVGQTVADAKLFIVSKLAKEAQPERQTAPEIESSGKAVAAGLFEEGRKLYEAKNYSGALEKFDSVLTTEPDVDVVHLYRGLTLVKLKRSNEALAAFDSAISAGEKRRPPNDKWFALPQYQRALLLISKRQHIPAEEAFNASIAATPTANALAGRGNLYLTRGQLLGKQNKWDEAEPWFRKAQADAVAGTTIDPANGKLWSMKTITHIMLNEHEDACISMRKTCELGDCSILDQFPQCKPGGS